MSSSETSSQTSPQGPPQILKRRRDSTTEYPPIIHTKSVHFQGLGGVPNLQSQSRIIECHSMQRLRKDLCDVLNEKASKSSMDQSCLTVLGSSGNGTCQVYRHQTKLHQNSSCQRKSLEELIFSRGGPEGDLSMFEKLHLAKTVALAVLRYFSTRG